jgi:hypothetical protein
MASRRPAVRLLSRGDAVVVTLAASLDSVATVHPSHETEIYARLANMIKVLVNERYCVTTDLPIIPYYVKLTPPYSLSRCAAAHFSFWLLADNLCVSVLCTRATIFDLNPPLTHTSPLIHQMNRLGVVRGR